MVRRVRTKQRLIRAIVMIMCLYPLPPLLPPFRRHQQQRQSQWAILCLYPALPHYCHHRHYPHPQRRRQWLRTVIAVLLAHRV